VVGSSRNYVVRITPVEQWVGIHESTSAADGDGSAKARAARVSTSRGFSPLCLSPPDKVVQAEQSKRSTRGPKYAPLLHTNVQNRDISYCQMKEKAPGVGERVRPRGLGPRERFLDSCEARVGTLVRLLDGRKRNGRGSVGRLERIYGHPDYLAVDVRFEDGSAELCWHHELAREADAPLSP
jgi:hypothetical protein